MMTETPTRTPSSVRRRSASSPPNHSPIITGVSALSSSTDEPADAAAATVTPSPPQRQREAQRPTRAVVEALSDAEDGDGGAKESRSRLARLSASLPTSTQQASSSAQYGQEDAPVHITAAAYADRRRLLYHITYLSTQLQRAQLQVEDLTRTVCVLRGLCGSGDEKSAEDNAPAATSASTSAAAAAVRAAVTNGATTAAVLAAHEEAEVQAALQAGLAVFDPVIAQTQIYRLDDALAQLGLLREAELAQLQTATAALQEHRTLASRLTEEAAQLRTRATMLEQQKQHAETQLTAATLEVERLRHEELLLNQRVAGLQELAQDGTWMHNVRVVGQAKTSTSSSSPLAQLEEDERLARQELLLDVFWDPVLIAFDAGLTWITDSAALRQDGVLAAPAAPAAAGGDGDAPGAPELEEDERLSLVQAGVVVEAPPPPTDNDLLLLRHQQVEVTELRARVQLLQDRNRLVELEKERLHSLYENEMRRSERMAQDHVAQLQQAYDEVVKDRQCIMSKLKGEVEEQLRLAFEDGRAYAKSSLRSRSRPSQKLLRPSNGAS
ncbi:hypothetical protein ABB37_05760 [Leptomonas pyrrhocoris]|uniref:Uncharacterized protein n=1 Tax=Leptomonas pyrrhocoris TaxID=157538 RepID=A0A0M9FZI8_LEPPY|nr:hypothetical protein ABB37_05760 [Leptomonas pyrrhocoris]KPA79295.1 hypothetical protein ABB37_05760 [Leptomonas pyrrhocoris]|eukprot:XP_015657734.1 hypothetical protein ABB37_05760 [Leptomonas pyrrhocoris]